MEFWLTPLVEAGVDVLHGADGLNFAGWAKKLTGAISVGSVRLSEDFITSFSGGSAVPSGLGQLITRMERGEFDLIAVGRANLTNPQRVAKVRQGDQTGLKEFSPADLAELV